MRQQAAESRSFFQAQARTAHIAVLSLMLFWGVSAPVLVTANELRVQLGVAMRRLSAALQRNGRNTP
mgnify:CR=1 FL=1